MADDNDRWWEAPGVSQPNAGQPPTADPTLLAGAGGAPPSSGQFAQPAIPSPYGNPPPADPTILAGGGAPAGSGQFAQPAIPSPYGGPPPADPTILAGGGTSAGSGQFPQPAPQAPVADPTLLAGSQPGQPNAAPRPAGSGAYAQPAQPYGYQQPGHPPQYGAHPPYGQQPGYGQQGYGFAGAPQPYSVPPQRGGGGGTVLAIGAVLVVVGLVALLGLAYATGVFDDDSTTASSSARATSTPTTPLAGTSTVPVTPGSLGVLIPTQRVAYDVPATWVIEDEYNSVSFTTALGSMRGRGFAHEGRNYCPGSAYRALSGVTASLESDPTAAATAVAKIAAAGGYSDASGGKLAAPIPLTTAGGVSGVLVESVGPWKPRIAGCTADSYSVYTFGFRNAADVTLVLTLLVDRGTTGELTAEQARVIVNSLRLV